MESVETASSLDSVIHKTSEDFAEFLKISSTSYAASIEDSMEAVLARLDELYGMLDMIRSDNNLVIDNLLPQVRTSMATLEPVFQTIDRLEEFVQMVKGNVEVVEKEVRLAEKDYGTFNSIKKVVSGLSIFGSKKKESQRPRVPSSSALYKAPNIFSTKEWFEHEKEETQTGKEPENVQEIVEVPLLDTSNEEYELVDCTSSLVRVNQT